MKVLVVAKAPVAGQVKTRLGADIGMQAAAQLAAAALLDTLEAANHTVPPEQCHLSLAGDLRAAEQAGELNDALAGWTIAEQRGDGFAERLVNAHLDAGDGLLVQIGMDTPHVTPELLHAAGEATADHDVTLGPAVDGGWWVLGRHLAESVRPLGGVQTSTETTYLDTVAALEANGYRVGTTGTLRDVDTVADADIVAELMTAGRFKRLWESRTAECP